jgi:two-component system sensor kinase FixL
MRGQEAAVVAAAASPTTVFIPVAGLPYWFSIRSGPPGRFNPLACANRSIFDGSGGGIFVTDTSFFVFGLLAAFAAAPFVIAGVRRSRAKSVEIVAANRRFRATFEQAAVGIAHLDSQWRLLRINERFCQITGYECGELLGKTADDITHPDDRRSDRAVREQLLAGEIDHASSEKRYVGKDGRIVWVNITRSAIRDAAGRPEFFVAVAEEITARKEAESRLSTGEAQYRAIFDSSVEAMVVIDANGMIQSVNPSVERIFGYAPSELIGGNIKMLMSEEVRSDHADFLRRYRETGVKTIIGREVTGQRKNGTVFSLDLSVAEWKRDGDTFFTGAMRDVSARKEAEAALAASEAHFAAIYAQPGAAVAETDLQRRFVSANDRYCELVGRSREELLQLRMKDIVHPEDIEETGPLFDRLAAAGKPFTVEKRYVKADGSIAWVMSTASSIKLDDAEPTIVVVAIDVTERKQAETALRASEESLRLLQNEFAHMSRVNDLGEMAAAIAHEINQPLTAIVNYLNTGLFVSVEGDSEDGFAEAGQMMQRASEQALRAGDIVRRLREFVGKGNGVRTVERAERLVDSAMALALIDARSSGIAVDREAGAGVAEVEVDAVQIQQVLVNLLRNAVDALTGAPKKAGARLTVSTCAKADGMLEFTVADNGPGITPRLADRIFEPFITTKSKGMGMGLSVCRRLIESHGGTIDAESEPGAGAAFRFTLPQYRSIAA